MKFLHTMVRVLDLEKSLEFYRLLGLQEIRRNDYEQGRFTLVFLATEKGGPEIELTHNWDEENVYSEGRNFGHVAFEVEDIYVTCQHFMDCGIEISRPPRDGYMAFIRSPDKISIEILQKGKPLSVKEPWASMKNRGSW